MPNKKYVYLIALVFGLVTIAIISSGQFTIPNINVGGGIPITTKVKVTRSIISNPWISGVTNTISGVVPSSIGSFDISPQLFEWNGRLVVTVIFPDGHSAVVGSRHISLDVLTTKEFSFIWYTRETGKHTVIVRLYDDHGTLVDEKISYIYVYNIRG